jgi:hypothetical protein
VADVTQNLQYEDMSSNTPASEIMKRGQELKTEQSNFQQSAGEFFDNEASKQKSTAALAEAQKQTKNMKDAMQFKNANFDSALRDAHVLDSLQAGAKQQLVDAKIQFSRDAQGRKLMSESQMQDWMLTKAKSEEDWKNYAQRSQQLHDRKIMLLQAAKNKIEQAEQESYQILNQKTRQNTQEDLARYKADVEKKVAKAKQTSANNSAIIGGVFTVAGAVVGSIVPGAGTAAGAMVGGALGAIAVSQMNK